MQTIKLHEATKQFKISNKLAMFFLEKKNMPVKSHSSVITMDQLELLREFSNNLSEFPDISDEFERFEKKPQEITEIKKPGDNEIYKEDGKGKEEYLEEQKKKSLEQEKERERERDRIREQERRKERDRAREQERNKERDRAREQEKNKERDRAREQERNKERERAKEQEKNKERNKEIDKEKYPGSDKETGKIREEEKIRDSEIKKDREKEIAARQQPPTELKVKEHPGEPETLKIKEEHRRPPIPGVSTGKPFAPVKKFDQKLKKKRFPGAGGISENLAKVQKETELQKQREKNLKYKEVRKDSTPPGIVKRDFKRDQSTGYRFRRDRIEEERKPAAPQVKRKLTLEDFKLPEMIQISNYITFKELAEKLNLKLKYIEEKMREQKKEYVVNQVLETEDIKEICKEFKVEVDIVPFEDYIHYNHIEKFKAQLAPRAPVVTVMGHVDHGKTTLLDTLRNTKVAEKEVGGITQKIGAYKLDTGGQSIIFLDTPGHEAFTNIRSRGASVTDLVILVVAANDGVKPQTIEAINHARAAGVPMVVAINKIDMPGADPNKVKQDLTKYNIVVEEWGGDVVSVDISAKLNQNIDTLLEMVGLSAEMLELKAYHNIPGRGTIIESRLDAKLGPIGTLLIQHGKIEKGDFFICGNSVGKIKSIFDDKGLTLDEAEAPLPVEIMGFEEVPQAGEILQVTDDIEKARKVIDIRKMKGKEARKEEIDAEKRLSLQNLFERMDEDKSRTFPIIIKTDNFSSGEVLESILLKQQQEKLKIVIIYKGIGNITESDILLAGTSGARIIGFNVKTPQKIISLAKKENIEIKLYNIIYHLIEDVARVMKGEIEPEYVESQIGIIEVLQLFKISKMGIIAGCLVKEGKVTNKSRLKVIRNNDLVFTGELETLRRIKNDAAEVNAGTECGIRIKNFNDIEVGDILEAYEIKIKT